MKTYNLEQDIVENYTKLTKKSFSMEYFTAGLWQSGKLDESRILSSRVIISCSCSRTKDFHNP